MRDIRIAAVQFEPRDGDKPFNLGRIRDLTREAVSQDAEFALFHEMCIPHYTFMQALSRSELEDLAEPVPGGPSTRALQEISRDAGIPLSAGLLEVDEGRLFNTQVVLSPEGFVTRHRKIHAFIHPEVSSGDSYTVFDLLGCRFGLLICYDNNLPENVRIVTLMGAEIVLMPHVTCGTESPMPGRGVIDREIWENRDRDPVRCRQEFLGPKGREWLMKWLPARAWENGVYAVFANTVGIDYDTVKTGNSMILDPFGEILVESNELGDAVVTGLCTAEKIELGSGKRYLRARRPDLYAKLAEPLPPGVEPVTHPGWKRVRSKV